MSTPSIEFRYSSVLASSGNSADQVDPSTAFGAYISTTAWSGSASGNLFSDDNLTGTIAHRCVFAANGDRSYTLKSASVYVYSDQPATATVDIGVDPNPATLLGSASVQAEAIDYESMAPAGVVFSAPSTAIAALPLGDLTPGTCRAVWIRRTSTGVQPAENQSVVLRLSGTLAL